MTAATPREPDAPRVSVLMPAHNHAAFVASAIESVWAQTFRSLELIVVDDGSQDGTADVVAALAARSPIAMKLIRAPHGGICRALNLALAESRGEWLSILGSDDEYRPTKIERQLEAIERMPGCLAVHCDYDPIDRHGALGTVHEAKLPPAEGSCFEALLRRECYIYSVCVMIRRDFVVGLGGWDESYPMEDWPMAMRITRAGTVAYAPEPLVRRRIHGDNATLRELHGGAFSPRQIALPLLGRLVSADAYPELALIQLAAVVQASLVNGSWRRGFSAFAYAWKELPGRRPRLLRIVARSLAGFVWFQGVRKPLRALFG